MVRIKKLITLSLLLSLITTPFLSAMTLDELAQSGSRMEVEEFSKLDLDNYTMLFDSSHVITDGLDKGLRLGADKDGFFVQEGKNFVRVQSCDTDEILKGHSLNEIALYGITSKFKVSQFDNGEYKVTAAEGLQGGGIGGAWAGALFGKALVHFVGHGVIQIVGVCTGPAYPATVFALEAALLPTVIEPMSNVAAIGFGVAGGVATGPV